MHSLALTPIQQNDKVTNFKPDVAKHFYVTERKFCRESRGGKVYGMFYGI